jgi:hypothetical protein
VVQSHVCRGPVKTLAFLSQPHLGTIGRRHTQATSHERSITSGFEARRDVGRQV